MGMLSVLGLAPSESDKKLKKLVDNSYVSVRVVGRGTIRIDSNEVRSSKEFKKAQEQAKKIVSSS